MGNLGERRKLGYAEYTLLKPRDDNQGTKYIIPFSFSQKQLSFTLCKVIPASVTDQLDSQWFNIIRLVSPSWSRVGSVIQAPSIQP